MSHLLLAKNIEAVRKRLCDAAIRSGREPDGILLIAATKTVSIERVIEAAAAGLRIFGENRVQEALKKVTSAESRVISGSIEWHLIGHLQKNKAKYAVQLFDLIHSLDSVELAAELNRQAEKTGKIQDVLAEIKLSPEETKHGIPEEGLIELLESANDFKNLRLKGLMTIPPLFENPEDARPYFRKLRQLRDTAVAEGFNLPELSMGMSNDFEVAIEEGATMIRIGAAIFGQRVNF